MAEKTPQRDIQEKAKKLVEEGIEVLKAGWHGAEVVAGKTVTATRLHYQNRRTQADLYRAIYTLGRAVYEQLKASRGKSLALAPNLVDVYQRVVELEHKIEEVEKDLSHSTVVAHETTQESARPQP